MPISSTDIKTINPEMKFRPECIGVVESPEVYQYSIRKELCEAEKNYDKFIKSVEKRKRAKLSEKHPTLSKIIYGVCKVTLGICAIACIARYRHSIPLLKSICKTPKTPPPNFKNDIKSLFKIK